MNYPAEVTLVVRARRTYESGKGGTIHVRFIDNVGKVMVDGEEVGTVSSLVGGGVEIAESGHSYTVDAVDLWAAFQAALLRQPIDTGEHLAANGNPIDGYPRQAE
jgi:hypothetical protein